MHQHGRVLAAREQQRRVLELGRNLAQDIDRLVHEDVEKLRRGQLHRDRVQSGGAVGRGGTHRIASVFRCRPHSGGSACSHHQRPARMSSAAVMARVQGAQPMLAKPWSCSGL